MSEIAGSESRLPVSQFEGHRLFSCYVVFNLGRAQGDKQVVMAMTVHERSFVGSDLHFECANILVLEGLVMMRLGSNFDFVALTVRERRKEKKHSNLHGTGLYRRSENSAGHESEERAAMQTISRP